ncbi:MAG TPA: sigma-70 family RNA polymerase sigma factor [Terriglobales bacterium]|nr:sigma-70 family RNA polymerase sigma factor [Terriglobales bacterium]
MTAPRRSDEQLVRACLRGEEAAWAALIARYQRLIYSIPLKYRFSRDDANDIFQAVCLDLLRELPRLREVAALPAWLMRTTQNKCFHHKRMAQRFVPHDDSDDARPVIARGPAADQVLQEVREEQMLRAAIETLPPRCRELVHMLFFEQPARPYAEVARRLGLATGSIGFMRRRCLVRLRQALRMQGLE